MLLWSAWRCRAVDFEIWVRVAWLYLSIEISRQVCWLYKTREGHHKQLQKFLRKVELGAGTLLRNILVLVVGEEQRERLHWSQDIYF